MIKLIKKTLPTIFLLSFFSWGQEINPNQLNNLSPEQIALVTEQLGNNLNVKSESKPEVTESTKKISNNIDSNKTKGSKYGYSFFSTVPTSIAAVGDLPIPNNYRISLQDQFTVILSGSKEAIFDLDVKLDGTILFPELGSIFVVGETFEDVKLKLRNLIDQSYIGVQIDLSIKNLAAKKITIVGAVSSPGTYLVNPFSTISSALAYSGGISEFGTLRNIKLLRNNGDSYNFDLYKLLINGDRSDDITIEAGDVILVDSAKNFISLDGEVIREAIYEVKENETLEDLISFGLGFTKLANKSNISLKVLDINSSSIVNIKNSDPSFSLSNVLSVEVFRYINKNSSTIRVEGAIKEPGFYSIDEYEDLESLIKRLEFIDVYPWLAILEQFDENKLVKSSVMFSLKDPSTYKSIKLLPNSRIYFANIDSRSFVVNNISAKKIADYSLIINHKQKSLELPVYGEYSVSSFVDFLGLDMSDVSSFASYVSPLENIVINDDYKNMQFVAKKYNTVSFRSPQNNLIKVNIKGAVEYPGTYTLSDNSTIQDLYKLIGEFKAQAYFDGIILTREVIRNRQLKSIEKSKEDLNKALLVSAQKGEIIGDINLIKTLSETIDPENLGRLAGNFSPNSTAAINTVLFDGDTLIVPKNPNAINVLGEVLNPIAFEYSKEINIRSAIDQAGGYQQFADKRRVYVIKANGTIEKPRNNVFVGNVDLEPGDSVIVPRKTITNNPALEAITPITQILSDIAFSAAALETLSSNN